MNGRHCRYGESGHAECVPDVCRRPVASSPPCPPLSEPCPRFDCASATEALR